jgi:hypothetical protein
LGTHRAGLRSSNNRRSAPSETKQRLRVREYLSERRNTLGLIAPSAPSNALFFTRSVRPEALCLFLFPKIHHLGKANAVPPNTLGGFRLELIAIPALGDLLLAWPALQNGRSPGIREFFLGKDALALAHFAASPCQKSVMTLCFLSWSVSWPSTSLGDRASTCFTIRRGRPRIAMKLGIPRPVPPGRVSAKFTLSGFCREIASTYQNQRRTPESRRVWGP